MVDLDMVNELNKGLETNLFMKSLTPSEDKKDVSPWVGSIDSTLSRRQK